MKFQKQNSHQSTAESPGEKLQNTNFFLNCTQREPLMQTQSK